MAFIEVLSNLKHNGDNLVKGTVIEAEATQFGALFQEGVLRVIEGAESLAGAIAIAANDAKVKLELAQAALEQEAQDDTWAAKKEEAETVTPSAPADGAEAKETTGTAPIVGQGDQEPAAPTADAGANL